MNRLVLVAALVLIAVTAPLAHAAKPAPVEASIAVAEQTATSVSFTTTIPALKGWEESKISTACWQDVNADGSIDFALAGPDIVYSQLTTPDAAVPLDWTSIWSLRGGGPAVCRADLDSYGQKGQTQVIRVLASVWFEATR